MQKILIVEDDEKLCRELEVFLEKNGYQTEGLKHFDNVAEDILRSNSHLVLLDINLPRTDGTFVCREVRRTSDIPVIMITSRNTELDELLSMNCGADDFVTKPFHPQILLARIAAVLKRVYKEAPQLEQIDCGSFILDITKGTVTVKGAGADAGGTVKEGCVELTKNEQKILLCLAKKRQSIVTRDEIISSLWDSEMFVDDNTLTVNVNRLRAKLEETGIKDAILTKRGQGYLLV